MHENVLEKIDKKEKITDPVVKFTNFDAEIAVIGCLLWDNRTYEKIETIEEVKEEQNVYNFEVDDTHTYIVEDYVVHIKRSRQKHRGHTRAMRNGGRIRRNR